MSSTLRTFFTEHSINMDFLLSEKNLAMSPILLDDNISDESQCEGTYDQNDLLKYASNIILIDTASKMSQCKDNDKLSYSNDNTFTSPV